MRTADVAPAQRTIRTRKEDDEGDAVHRHGVNERQMGRRLDQESVPRAERRRHQQPPAASGPSTSASNCIVRPATTGSPTPATLLRVAIDSSTASAVNANAGASTETHASATNRPRPAA